MAMLAQTDSPVATAGMRRIRYRASPTMHAMHRSNAFVRGIRGPVGSGKSVGCVMDLFRIALQQAPNAGGVRRSRFAVIRNTYPELKSTTIKTFQEWIPEDICPIKWDAPISGLMQIPHPDGKTKVEAEFIFLALDKAKDVKKLLSLELTAAWINEARELPYSIVIAVRQRCGRFPRKDEARLTQAGVLMDTNSMDADHWWARLEVYGRLTDDDPIISQSDFEFFTQPAALIKRGDRYLPNPRAENAENQQLGYRYWLNQIAGSKQSAIDVYVLNQFGMVIDGRPVWPEYQESVHLAKDVLRPIPGLPLILGWDFGLTPACIVGQLTPRGQLRILDEFTTERMGIRQLASEVVVPQLRVLYPGFELVDMVGAGDPAGAAAADTDEATCFQELQAAGFDMQPASTNDFLPRREAVAWFLTRFVDGQPAFLLSPRCKVLRMALSGAYNYRRMMIPGKEIYRDEPDKDRFSHPSDALQYLCLYVRGQGGAVKSQAERARAAEARREIAHKRRRVVGMIV